MAKFEPLNAVGLMSGTSMDGVDAALLRTDGETAITPGPALTLPYGPVIRERLRAIVGGHGPVDEVAREITLIHGEAVAALRARAAVADIDVIGFHGHTILHDPARRRTWQIGDGGLLARETGTVVFDDFRAADIAAGGEGAPLAPVYHAALAHGLDRPLAVLNLGGVANLTWIGAGENELIAFDTGPGNALLDDWAAGRTGMPYDRDGALAARGRVDAAALAVLLDHPYFARPPPKSLDRGAFDPAPVAGLGAADGAATLAAFTAAAVGRARVHLPVPPTRWLVCGGGRHNPVLMRMLAERTGAVVEPVEAAGWDGDALEAQAFAYLAVRSLRGLPLTLPGTTGVGAPLTGGRRHAPPAQD